MPEWALWVLCGVLLALSALFTGLNIGLLGVDKQGLEIIIAGGSPQDRQYALKVKPVLRFHNMVLCTILLANTAVNAAFVIAIVQLCDTIWTAFGVATGLTLLLGELGPQALLSGHPLALGARFVWLMKILLVLLAPIAWPLSKALDSLLGSDLGTVYNKQEFKKLVEMQIQSTGLLKDEANIMKGALELGTRTVSEIMTPIDKVYMLEVRRRLDVSCMTEIWKSGYSRIPVYDCTRSKLDNIVGLLFVKDLILIDPADNTPISSIIDFYGREVPYEFPDCRLRDLLEQFKSGRSHLAIVHKVVDDDQGDPHYENAGLVTLEDIIETLIQAEIADEHDEAELHGTKAPRRQVENLALYSRRKMPNFLTPQEASAIFFQLSGTVDVFRPEKRLMSEPVVKRLIQDSEIITVLVADDRDSPARDPKLTYSFDDSKSEAPRSSLDVSAGGVCLYQRGVPSDYFTVVLDGTVEIRAGSQGFVSEIGRWSVLCSDALESLVINPAHVQHRPSANQFAISASSSPPPSTIEAQKPYVPDFTAKCITNTRVLRIHRIQYLKAVYGMLHTSDREIDSQPQPLVLQPLRHPNVRRGASDSQRRAPRSVLPVARQSTIHLMPPPDDVPTRSRVHLHETHSSPASPAMRDRVDSKSEDDVNSGGALSRADTVKIDMEDPDLMQTSNIFDSNHIRGPPSTLARAGSVGLHSAT